MCCCESLLSIAERLKKNRIERERQDKLDREKVREDIDNTPYLEECCLVSALMVEYFNKVLKNLSVNPTFDLGTTYSDGRPKRANYYPSITVSVDGRYYCELVVVVVKNEIVNTNNRIDINSYFIDDDDNKKVIEKENFIIDFDGVKELFNYFKSNCSLAQKNYKHLNHASFPKEVLNVTFNNYFIKDNNNYAVKNIIEICEAVYELLPYMEKTKGNIRSY